ncbi:hypothetical protein QY97_00484 [Bacillus thermotolerans]|uniref:Uncharacterized protein n=1 Tax=Bacillus thermotolerans TaxID=1221996 RepID=A0A0F5HVP7_BACTR|nr:hypothetical protein QY97_00484 [Bacillus thermotolerans]KKB39450.1 hypothetical protein QY96_02831 [Bacillus thermotolerans]KKB40273.1 hypothetical protein QY95_01768 [Bacillus thermotolerans]
MLVLYFSLFIQYKKKKASVYTGQNTEFANFTEKMRNLFFVYQL